MRMLIRSFERLEQQSDVNVNSFRLSQSCLLHIFASHELTAQVITGSSAMKMATAQTKRSNIKSQIEITWKVSTLHFIFV